MSREKKTAFAFMTIVSILIASCATVGQYMPSSPGETMIGTIQTSFVARDSWFSKNETINMQAYIKLKRNGEAQTWHEKAAPLYPTNNFISVLLK